jgi:hypothetical protein
MKYLADEVYPNAEKIVIVMDNLNTHSPISFYQTFEPERHFTCRTALNFITRRNMAVG